MRAPTELRRLLLEAFDGAFPPGGVLRLVVWPLILAAFWLVWMGLAIVPEWTGSRANRAAAAKALADRAMLESAYDASWMTRYSQAHGEMPLRIPPNPSAAGNRRVLDLCPSAPVDLVRSDADWAWCPTDGRVRALARDPTLLLPDGGAQSRLDATQAGMP
jgi:hypothetical protein